MNLTLYTHYQHGGRVGFVEVLNAADTYTSVIPLENVRNFTALLGKINFRKTAYPKKKKYGAPYSNQFARVPQNIHLNRWRPVTMDETRVLLPGNGFLPASLLCDPDVGITFDGKKLPRRWHIAPKDDVSLKDKDAYFREHQQELNMRPPSGSPPWLSSRDKYSLYRYFEIFRRSPTSHAFKKMAETEPRAPLPPPHLILQFTSLKDYDKNAKEWYIACHPYFPAIGKEPLRLKGPSGKGDIIVTRLRQYFRGPCLEHYPKGRWRLTVLQIKYFRLTKFKDSKPLVRKIIHSQYLGWPDDGVASVDVVDFMSAMERLNVNPNDPEFDLGIEIDTSSRWKTWEDLPNLTSWPESSSVPNSDSDRDSFDPDSSSSADSQWVLEEPEAEVPPMVEHCSVGIGRSGSFRVLQALDPFCKAVKQSPRSLEEDPKFPPKSNLEGYTLGSFYEQEYYPPQLPGVTYDTMDKEGPLVGRRNVLLWVVGGMRSQRRRVVQGEKQWWFILICAAVRCGCDPKELMEWVRENGERDKKWAMDNQKVLPSWYLDILEYDPEKI
ncbi:hypothetical protein T439DRAFT_357921 [Meredithblackwellia eburnea MCA 4105]